jgi:hypothetical protein
MYDKFEAFLQLDKQNFSFLPYRYEVWKTGQMVENGNINKPIIATVSDVDGEEKVVVTFIDQKLNIQLASTNIYDLFTTSVDRLQLLTIPQQTNAEDNMAIQMFKMTIGPTRAFKNFNTNEPYCCNIFTINGTINKITFSFSNPEKLIEFYSE